MRKARGFVRRHRIIITIMGVPLALVGCFTGYYKWVTRGVIS
jgi:hypothetical protein